MHILFYFIALISLITSIKITEGAFKFRGELVGFSNYISINNLYTVEIKSVQPAYQSYGDIIGEEELANNWLFESKPINAYNEFSFEIDDRAINSEFDVIFYRKSRPFNQFKIGKIDPLKWYKLDPQQKSFETVDKEMLKKQYANAKTYEIGTIKNEFLKDKETSKSGKKISENLHKSTVQFNKQNIELDERKSGIESQKKVSSIGAKQTFETTNEIRIASNNEADLGKIANTIGQHLEIKLDELFQKHSQFGQKQFGEAEKQTKEISKINGLLEKLLEENAKLKKEMSNLKNEIKEGSLKNEKKTNEYEQINGFKNEVNDHFSLQKVEIQKVGEKVAKKLNEFENEIKKVKEGNEYNMEEVKKVVGQFKHQLTDSNDTLNSIPKVLGNVQLEFKKFTQNFNSEVENKIVKRIDTLDSAYNAGKDKASELHKNVTEGLVQIKKKIANVNTGIVEKISNNFKEKVDEFSKIQLGIITLLNKLMVGVQTGIGFYFTDDDDAKEEKYTLNDRLLLIVKILDHIFVKVVGESKNKRRGITVESTYN